MLDWHAINHVKWKLLFQNVNEDVMEIFSLKHELMNFLFKLPAELIKCIVYNKL